LDHIADAYACIQKGELAFVNPASEERPDYFCQDSGGATVLAESKGATGTRGKITGRIDPEGWGQVNNVAPVNLPLRNPGGRLVLGTHICIETMHPLSETTTIIKDPEGDPGVERNPESDMLIRLAYAKALRFMGHDSIAERLIGRRQFPAPFRALQDARLPDVAGVPFLPLAGTPYGDAIGLYGPTAKALINNSSGALRQSITESLRGLREQRGRLTGIGYALPNGVIVLHEPEEVA
jgi:hypothetical protein